MKSNKKFKQKVVSMLTVASLMASYCPSAFVSTVFAATNGTTPTWTAATSSPTADSVYLNWNITLPDSEYFCKEDFENTLFDYTGLSGGGVRIS